MKKKLTLEDRLVDGFCLIICLIVLFCCLYPFYYLLIMSFNDGTDAMRGGIYLFPRKFTLKNYFAFFEDAVWFRAFVVTAARTVVGTVSTVIVTCLVAYGLSYQRLMFRKVYTSVIIFCMYCSGGLIPYYVVLRSLGLINTFGVYIIPSLLSLFFVLVGITFFQGIPPELREAALIDGSSEFSLFFRIILPVSLPFLATIALFSGVGHWNSWFDSAFFVQSPELRTLGYVLMQIINKNTLPTGAAAQVATLHREVTSKSVQMAAMVIAVFPIMCVYPFLQKYFVKGGMIGAVKG